MVGSVLEIVATEGLGIGVSTSAVSDCDGAAGVDCPAQEPELTKESTCLEPDEDTYLVIALALTVLEETVTTGVESV